MRADGNRERLPTLLGKGPSYHGQRRRAQPHSSLPATFSWGLRSMLAYSTAWPGPATRALTDQGQGLSLAPTCPHPHPSCPA